jgi:hypothetical protein
MIVALSFLRLPFLLSKSLYLPLALAAPTHDETIGTLILAGLETFCRHAPWRYRMTSTRRLTLTTTMRVIDRIHGHAPHRWTLAAPAICSGFTKGPQVMFTVTYFSERCATFA